MFSYEKERHKVRLDVPLFIDWLHIWYCCRKKGAYDAYTELIKHSNLSVRRDLDLIRFIRAKRLHGFGLNTVLSKI